MIDYNYFTGKCGPDGIYYKDAYSFVVCTHHIAYEQPCPPGTRNRAFRQYDYGDFYHKTSFCDENLVDYGYTIYNKHPPQGPGAIRYRKILGNYGSHGYGFKPSYPTYNAPTTSSYAGYGKKAPSYGKEYGSQAKTGYGFGAKRSNHLHSNSYGKSNYGNSYGYKGKTSFYGNHYGTRNNYHDRHGYAYRDQEKVTKVPKQPARQTKAKHQKHQNSYPKKTNSIKRADIEKFVKEFFKNKVSSPFSQMFQRPEARKANLDLEEWKRKGI